MLTMPKYTYLYGFTKSEIKALAIIPYKEALQIMIKAGKDLNQRLLSVPYLESDTYRINEVDRAINTNIGLLKQLI